MLNVKQMESEMDKDICPHCGKAMVLAHGHAEGNVLAYGTPAITLTECCNKMIRHYRVQYTKFEKANMPESREDDWGYEAKDGS
jgi:hypothetical protein